MFPADPVDDRQGCWRHGAGRRSGRADREWRELYAALD
jgi:hypothetical protein